jgi:3-keto-L-gulonate-6-phosphate decarboxylase
VQEAKRLVIYAVIDMLNVEDVLGKWKSIKEFPDIALLHRGIDQESGRSCGLERIKMIRQAFP